MNILLIEDDHHIVTTLRYALARDHYAITHASSGERGLSLARRHHYDAIVLDLNLPDVSGLQVCQQLQALGSQIPVLILSADIQILSKIKLLDAGASDYLTKPFSLGELKARLRKLQRQQQALDARPVSLHYGGLLLNVQSRTVQFGDRIVGLRPKEFAMLECLMQHAGQAVSRVQLSNHAWRYSDKPWTNTIDVHIKHLRDKLDSTTDKTIIQTVHGVGYKLALPQVAAVGATYAAA